VSDGAYGLLNVSGNPTAIGDAIAREIGAIDLDNGDGGPPVVFLDVRIRILRRYLTPTERATLIAAFDAGIAECEADATHGAQPRGLVALTMARDLGYDWERDDDLMTWALRASPLESMIETKRRALVALCGEGK